MRLLFVHRRALHGSGDDVYDRKLLGQLSSIAEVTRLCLDVGDVHFIRKFYCVIRGLPHDRAASYSKTNLNRITAALRSDSYSAVIVSHESLDWTIPLISAPTVLILHNITSAYVSMLGLPPFIVKAAQAFYLHYERQTYNRRQISLVVLSRGDEKVARKLVDAERVFCAWPGMPDNAPPPSPKLSPLLSIWGSYSWRPKRRDLYRFIKEVQSLPLETWPEFEAPLPDELACFNATPSDIGAISFGLISDRFVAGFKLKAGDYIANNKIVLTYSDIDVDYSDLPWSDLFVVKISHAKEILPLIKTYSGFDHDEMSSKFLEFKSAARQRFAWRSACSRVIDAAQHAIDLDRTGPQECG